MSLSLFVHTFPIVKRVTEVKLILGPGHYEVGMHRNLRLQVKLPLVSGTVVAGRWSAQFRCCLEREVPKLI